MNDVVASETKDIASTLIPTFSDGGKKAGYLSYRVSNFSMRESCKLANVSEKQVRRWREASEEFNHLDTDGLTELRKQMANEYLDMQFTRNFRLVMEKDFRVLFRDATGETLSEVENKYLEKIRQHYTPQSLAMIKQLLGGGTIDQPFDFTKLTMTIKREQIEIVGENNGQRSQSLIEAENSWQEEPVQS